MDDLVERLSKKQDVIASMRPEQRLDLFKAAVDRGYVHIKLSPRHRARCPDGSGRAI